MTTRSAPPERSFRTVGAVMALCWLAVFFDGMDVNIYGAVMPHLLDDSSLGFTTFAAAAVLGAAAICLVPLARRARHGAAAQQTSTLAGAAD
ncbi:hypothetical protein [Streptomyces sp. NPDC056192]|uniref:hypothetical protein n=1 Tax=unclassified Streptomyces TaxID=2593676 RepID=UPI0035DDD5E5